MQDQGTYSGKGVRGYSPDGVTEVSPVLPLFSNRWVEVALRSAE